MVNTSDTTCLELCDHPCSLCGTRGENSVYCEYCTSCKTKCVDLGLNSSWATNSSNNILDYNSSMFSSNSDKSDDDDKNDNIFDLFKIIKDLKFMWPFIIFGVLILTIVIALSTASNEQSSSLFSSYQNDDDDDDDDADDADADYADADDNNDADDADDADDKNDADDADADVNNIYDDTSDGNKNKKNIYAGASNINTSNFLLKLPFYVSYLFFFILILLIIIYFFNINYNDIFKFFNSFNIDSAGFIYYNSSDDSIDNKNTTTNDNDNNNVNNVTANYSSVPVNSTTNEVFNVSDDKYTYSEAQAICNSYGAEIATPSQVFNAYKNGSNWCNPSWSLGKYVLQPTQKNSSHTGECGNVGVNGSFVEDSSEQYGANCYRPPTET